MVDQNFILYVNEKHALRQSKIELTKPLVDFNFKFSVPEKHLICGLILNGKPIKGDSLENFPFKPIEKYLFEFTNVHFTIPQMEFTTENTDYNFNVSADSLANIEAPPVPKIPMGTIDSITPLNEYDDRQIFYTFIPEVESRHYNDVGWVGVPIKKISIKKPTDSVASVFEYTDYGSPLWLYDIVEEFFNGSTVPLVFPTGTKIKFIDGRDEFADTNEIICT